MGLRPHDLLRISDAAALPDFSALPVWAQDSLRAFPFVVVRRAMPPEGFAQIGIRGRERNQRAAALLPLHAVEECISPEKLATAKQWLETQGLEQMARADLPQFQALRQVAEAAEREALIWGPVGSVGFELATGAHVIRAESDLDIMLRFSSRIGTTALRRFRSALVDAPAHVDVVLEGDGRAAALDEYLEHPRRVLIRTPHGPRLGAFAG
jgi:phosphoribosyl-dephospho-CoA transferase